MASAREDIDTDIANELPDEIYELIRKGEAAEFFEGVATNQEREIAEVQARKSGTQRGLNQRADQLAKEVEALKQQIATLERERDAARKAYLELLEQRKS